MVNEVKSKKSWYKRLTTLTMKDLKLIKRPPHRISSNGYPISVIMTSLKEITAGLFL